MKRKRFSVEQIVVVLKQAELGLSVAELTRQVGISEQTFYRWKKQYGGLQSDQVRKLTVNLDQLMQAGQPDSCELSGARLASGRIALSQLPGWIAPERTSSVRRSRTNDRLSRPLSSRRG